MTRRLRRGLVALGLTVVVISALGSCAFRTMTVAGVPTIAPRAALPTIDSARLRADVEKLSLGFPGRSYGAPQVLDAAAAWIGDELRAMGASPADQPFTVDKITYRNVLARFGPETGPRVVVGAHYDAAEGFPAADDNASGVAALLALSRVWAKQPPSARVDVVFWSLEEPPSYATDAMGSVHHARALVKQGVAIRAVLSLETLGTYDDTPGSQHFPAPGLGLLYPDRGDFVAVVGDTGCGPLLAEVKGAMRGAGTIPVHAMAGPAWVPGIDWSDHRSYRPFGVPAVMITDTAPFRNPRYHTADDRPDRLDYVRLAKATQAVWAAVDHLAR